MTISKGTTMKYERHMQRRLAEFCRVIFRGHDVAVLPQQAEIVFTTDFLLFGGIGGC